MRRDVFNNGVGVLVQQVDDVLRHTLLRPRRRETKLLFQQTEIMRREQLYLGKAPGRPPGFPALQKSA